MDKHKKIDRFHFFAWNCLPDIRYVDKTIERKNFHIRNLIIDDLLEEKSDFWKGGNFYSFVDKNWDFLFQNVSANTEVGSSKIRIQNVKIFDISMISEVDNHVYL